MYSYRKKNIIIVVMMVAVLFMAVGYALLSTTLNVSGISDLTGSWGVKITNVSYQATGKAYNISEPTYTDTTVKFNVGVKVPGDKMTFTVTVQNFGNIDALLMNIDASASGTESIVYSINGINNQEVLKEGESKTFTVSTYFDINATELPVITTKDLTVRLNYVQYDEQILNTIPPQITDTTTQYGIMYVANGGIGTMEPTVCNVGEECTIRSNSFVREDYYFLGWSTSAVAGLEYYDNESKTDFTTSGNTLVLYAVWQKKNLVTTILHDNTAYADNVASPYVTSSTGIKFNALSSDTNGKGLYYTNTNTEGNNKTYYYRGAVDNNIVQFGSYKAGTTINGTTYNVDTPIYWKIVRINEDGSIRLIYLGTSATATSSASSIGSSPMNASYDDNAYMGYMYGTAGSSTYAATHANINNSTMKTYLDNWYKNNLLDYSSYIADAGFCNDRTIASSADLWLSGDTALGYGTNRTYYGAFQNVYKTKQLRFSCQQTNDLFTTKTSNKGNKALTYPIGLLTAYEAAYAGALYNNANTSYYLYTGSIYWLMSPYSFADGYAYGYVVNASGIPNLTKVQNGFIVRPVINLNSNVTLTKNIANGCTSQNGTSACPYIIDTSKKDTNGGWTSTPITYGVNFVVDNGGTVTPTTPTTTMYGGSVTAKITPNSGYEYVSNTCGGIVSGNTITVSNLINEMTPCTVVFQPVQHTVDFYVAGLPTQGIGVVPVSQQVSDGGTATVTLTPLTGYKYSSNTCGGTVSGNTMTVSNVREDINCTVTFTADTSSNTCSGGSCMISMATNIIAKNGTIDNSYNPVAFNYTSLTAAVGGSVSFTYATVITHTYSHVSCSGGTVSHNATDQVNGTITISNVNANITCTAYFQRSW